MKYLLDTHTIIWYLEASSELPKKIEALIDDPKIDIIISSVSLWEIVIKSSLKKLTLNLSLEELLSGVKTRSFHILQIEDGHLLNLRKLPYIHKDPFDRLLVASAISEDMTLITADKNIRKYNVKCVW